ncbi:MAG TPA: ABC transporter permease subunit [Natronosporangium sp.]
MNEWFGWRVPLGDWIDSGIDWLLSTFRFLWTFIRDSLETAYGELASWLIQPRWWLLVLLVGLLGWFAASELRDRTRPAWRYGLIAAGAMLAVDVGVWLVDRLGAELDVHGVGVMSHNLVALDRPASVLMLVPASWVLILLLAALGTLARGWLFGLFALATLLLIDLVAQWENAMQTFALVLLACAIAAVIGIPIGIGAARSQLVSSIVRPVLDFMQALPALIYVLIAVAFFSVGVVPGMVATVIFAMPPAVRLTELGIRQVDAEVVEAGHAFGSSPAKILRQIQLPLATPTIMAGVNQVIMLTLAMVVLAGMVGTPGLGRIVFGAITTGNTGLGLEGGISVVILAIYLDRVTAAIGARSMVARIQQAA